MTSRVSPKRCSLRHAVGESELCPGASCAFWEEGGSIVDAGCEIERLGIPVDRHRDLARHLLELRLTMETAGRRPSVPTHGAASLSCST